MNQIARSFRDAFHGLAYCFATQRNMTVHAVTGLLVVVSGFLLRVSNLDLFILSTAILAVLAAEAFNTALEKTVDLCTREENDLAHKAKDVAAGAVLLAALFAVLAGIYVFGPRLWQLLFVRGS